MMSRLGGWLLIVALAFALGACSVRKMVDRMVSDEDRALAMGVLEDIRTGDATGFEAVLAPDIKADSLPQLASATGYFPASPGTTEIIGYSTNSNYSNGVTTRSKSFTLITTDQKTWTTTQLAFAGQDGPLRLTGWNVTGSQTKPDAVRTLETLDTALPIAGAIVLLCAIGLIVLIVVLVRRSRRRAWEREHAFRRPD